MDYCVAPWKTQSVNARDKQIVRAYLCSTLSLEETGVFFDVGKERISQIIQKCLGIIRYQWPIPVTDLKTARLHKYAILEHLDQIETKQW